MGIPSYLLASTINISLAQRLLRTLCPHCKQKKEADPKDFPGTFELPKPINSYYTEVGCPECHYSGYQGRKAIYEMIPISKTLKTKIKNNEPDIDNYLKDQHINTLRNNALKLLFSGETSPKEVFPYLLQ